MVLFETAQYDPLMKMEEHFIEKIKKRRKRGEISKERALEIIREYNQFIAQRKRDLDICLKIIAVNYPESLNSSKDDIFSKALRRVRKRIRESEAAKVRRYVKHEKEHFK